MRKHFYLKGSCLAAIFACSNLAAVPFQSVFDRFLDDKMKKAEANTHLDPLFQTRDRISTFDSLREIGKVASGVFENVEGYFETLRRTYNFATATPAVDNEIFIAKVLEVCVRELNAGRTPNLEGALTAANTQLTGVILNAQRRNNAKNDSRIYLNNTGFLPFVKTLHTVKKAEAKGKEFNERLAPVPLANDINNVLGEANDALRNLSNINEKRYFLNGFLGDRNEPQSLLQKLIESNVNAAAVKQSIESFAIKLFEIVSNYGADVIKEFEGKDELRVKLTEAGFDLLAYLGDDFRTNLLANGGGIRNLLRTVVSRPVGERQDMTNCLRRKLCELFDCLSNNKFNETVGYLNQIPEFSDLAFNQVEYIRWSRAEIGRLRARQIKPLEDKLKIIEKLTAQDYNGRGINAQRRIMQIGERSYNLDNEMYALYQSAEYLRNNARQVALYNAIINRVKGLEIIRNEPDNMERINEFFNKFELCCIEYFNPARTQEERNAIILKKMELFRQISDIYPNVSELNQYWSPQFTTYFSHKTRLYSYRDNGERSQSIKSEIESIRKFKLIERDQVKFLPIPYHRRNSEFLIKNLVNAYSQGENAITPSMARTLLPLVNGMTAKERVALYYPNINDLAQFLWMINDNDMRNNKSLDIERSLKINLDGRRIDFQKEEAGLVLNSIFDMLIENGEGFDLEELRQYFENILEGISTAAEQYNRLATSMPANLDEYLRQNSFGPYLNEKAFLLMRKLGKEREALDKLQSRSLGDGYDVFGIDDPIIGGCSITEFDESKTETRIHNLNFTRKLFIDKGKARTKYKPIEELLNNEEIIVLGSKIMMISEGNHDRADILFLNSEVIDAFLREHPETRELVDEFLAAFSQYKLESLLYDESELKLARFNEKGLSWISETNQAAFNGTHTIENLEYKELNLADVRSRDFLQLQNRIYTYTNVLNYAFNRDSGNLSGVRCNEEELSNVYRIYYNDDWNRFIKDIKNYFVVPRTIGGHTLYSPMSLTQRMDIERSKKENAVTLLKLLDLTFKKNNGTGGLSLRFGYEVINLSDANAKDRIVAHTIDDIDSAAEASIRNVYPLCLRDGGRGDYSQALLNIENMFQMNSDRTFTTTGEIVTKENYIRHILDAVKCVLGKSAIHSTTYPSQLYKPENFSSVNYIFDIFQRLYDLLKTGQGEVDKVTINNSLGQLMQFSHHCSAGQAQGIAQLFSTAVGEDKWILPNLPSLAMLTSTYQTSIDYFIDSNLGFVDSYNYEAGEWRPRSANGEYAMKRAKIFNLIGNKFGRDHATIEFETPSILEFAKHIAVNKREIWDKISPEAKSLEFQDRAIRNYQALNSSQEAGRAFYNAVNDLNLGGGEMFVSEFAKVIITPEALAEHLSDPNSGLYQLIAKKLIQEEGEALFPDNIGEVAALRGRIEAGEEVKFTKEQLKTIVFKGMKKYGLIQ